MSAPKVRINNRFLNEYVFDQLYNLTKDERKNLNRKQMRATYNAKYAKQFATTASLEEKVEFLAKIGKPFWCGFGTINNKVITDLFKKYRDEGGNAAIKEMQDLGIFVFSDREVAHFMGLLSSNCHTETYMLNRDFLKTGYRVKRWKEGKSTKNDEISEATEAVHEMSKLVFHASIMNRYVQDEFGVDELQHLILLYLFRYKNKFVPVEELRGQLCPIYTTNKLSQSLRFLKDNTFIQKDASVKTVNYQITSLGIDTVMRYQKKLLNLVNNY